MVSILEYAFLADAHLVWRGAFMFEDSLVISQIQHTTSTARWTALASTSFQYGIAALILSLPLLHPERLAFRMDVPRVLIPIPVKSPLPTKRVQAFSGSSSTPTPPTAPALMPSRLPSLIQQNDDTPPVSSAPIGMAMASGLPSSMGIGDAGYRPHIAVVAARPSSGPVRISSGVSAGMLLTPIRPVYPNIAKVARVEGTVIVEAVISRAGTIESLRAVSGPIMLQQAALDAIRAARYRPFRLNGQPTEVQTTITVNFRMAS